MLVFMSLIDTADDRTKFEKIYREYKFLLFNIANNVLNNPQDAEDAVHSAFVKIAENIEKVTEAVCPKTKAFAVTIVENTAIDLYRKKKHMADLEPFENWPGAEINLDNSTVLAHCMGRLPARYRQMILLKYVYGFSSKEAAKLMNITGSNAIKLDQRAKQKFRQLCQEEGVML